MIKKWEAVLMKGYFQILNANGGTICTLPRTSVKRTRKDANLMAASPEMYQALDSLTKMDESIWETLPAENRKLILGAMIKAKKHENNN